LKSFFKVLSALLTPNFSWVTLLSGVALAVIGINVLTGTTEPAAAAKQTKWLMISLGMMAFTWLPHPKTIGYTSFILFLVTLALLVFLLIPGIPNSIVPVRNNARSWINLGFMNMQPSELTKITFILALAWYLRHRDNYRTLAGLLPPFFIMFIPVILILKEPDLGSAVMFVPALFFMLIAAGAKLNHLFTLVGIGLLGIALNIVMIYTLPNDMQILKKYQRERITQFVGTKPEQQQMAMRLVGSGGLWGYGEDRSKLIMRYNFLPENENDMVFAVVVNRWGLIGGLTVIGLYTVFTGSILLVGARLKEPFPRLVCVGFAGLLFCQGAMNISMTLGLLPITGITLPLISYGGSSLLSTFLMVGLVMNFATRSRSILVRPSFEYDNADAIFQ
tara:strand:+ start:37482 stop:38654 length:1173 start_codon:yes stop_codon:yes gene_type:complete